MKGVEFRPLHVMKSLGRTLGVNNAGRIATSCPQDCLNALRYYLLAFLLGVATTTHAETWHVDGANNKWSTPQIWVGDVVPTGNSAVVFASTSSKSFFINDVGTRSGGSLSIAATFKGRIDQNVPLTLSSFNQGGGSYNANSELSIADGGSNFYNVVITAAGVTWSFSDSTTMLGRLTVSAGTLATAKDMVGNVSVIGTLLANTNGVFIVRRSSTAGDGAGQTTTAATLAATGNMHADGQGFDPTNLTDTVIAPAGSHGGVGATWRSHMDTYSATFIRGGGSV